MYISSSILIFTAIFIGLFVSKIKIGRVSLDLSAVLIVSVLLGWIGTIFEILPSESTFNIQTDLLSTFGSSLFISAIGVSSGRGMRNERCKRCFQYFFIGVVTVLSGYLCMKIICWCNPNMNYSVLYGVFCGAMTSTPGFAAACEMGNISSELAVLGYGCAYIPGILGVLLFVQQYKKGKREDVFDQIPSIRQQTGANLHSEPIFLYLSFCSAAGGILGKCNIPLLNISLGNTGGILCVAVLVGYILYKIGRLYNQQALSMYRNLGLILFFVGTGIPSGIRLVERPQLSWMIYGMFIASTAIFTSYFICRTIFKKSLLESLCIVAGGMTSTPAIGVLLKNDETSRVDLSAYSMTYFGALMSMVFIVQI